MASFLRPTVGLLIRIPYLFLSIKFIKLKVYNPFGSNFPLLIQFLQYRFIKMAVIPIFSGASIDTDSFYSLPPYGVVLHQSSLFSPCQGIDSCRFRRRPVQNETILYFSWICSGLLELGMATIPFCRFQRRITCAEVFPYAVRQSVDNPGVLNSHRAVLYLPGYHPCTTIPRSWIYGITSFS